MSDPIIDELLNPKGDLFAAGQKKAYYKKVRQIYGGILGAFWTFGEASGNTGIDIIGGRNAVYDTHVIKGNAGIGDGKTSIFLNGNAYVDVYNIAPIFNGNEGGIEGFIKVDADFWDDTTIKYIFRLEVDASNYIKLYKTNYANGMRLDYCAGGTLTTQLFGLKCTQFLQINVSWSASSGVMTVSINGTTKTIKSISGTFTGTLSNAKSILLGQNKFDDSPYFGYAQYWKLFTACPASSQILRASYATSIKYKNITIIGDSISIPYYFCGWSDIIGGTYGTGQNRLFNHAIAGNSIMAHMDTQVAQAATDNADIIIIALGTNDDNAGNMTTLQAKVESNIVALKSSNPKAHIYYMNVLPRWYAPTDKGNIRTAIAAACTAQGITCWDTYTTPWIAQADTSDDLHPNEAGHLKIATQVLSRLP